MSQQVRRWDSLDAALDSATQIGLVLKVVDFWYLLAPQPLGIVPDHLHRHELAAVGAIVDDGDVIKFACFLHLVCSVKAKVVEYQRTGSNSDFNKPLDERDEAFLGVALLPRLTEHQLSALVDDGDGSDCLKRELVTMHRRPL